MARNASLCSEADWSTRTDSRWSRRAGAARDGQILATQIPTKCVAVAMPTPKRGGTLALVSTIMAAIRLVDTTKVGRNEDG